MVMEYVGEGNNLAQLVEQVKEEEIKSN